MNESGAGLGASPETAAKLMLPAITRLSLSDVCALVLIPHRSCFLTRSESKASFYFFNFFSFLAVCRRVGLVESLFESLFFIRVSVRVCDFLIEHLFLSLSLRANRNILRFKECRKMVVVSP